MVYCKLMVYSNTLAFDTGLQDLPNGAGLPEMGSSIETLNATSAALILHHVLSLFF
jgi:hypothetical protein